MTIDETMPSPDVETAFGRSWRVDLRAIIAALNGDPDENGMIAAWIVEARWAHPLWHSYYFSLCHLRPIPKLGPPVIHRPGATHEFLLHALNPEYPRNPQIDREAPRWLHPTNFGAQLIESSDDAAIATVEAAVGRVLNGQLNPDTDALCQWVALFGDAMVRK